jgi:hypothetical protein
MKNQTEAYLLSEATQAWTHYRHMEETRTKYLSFFATVILTSAGFLVTILKDIDKFEPVQLIASMSVFGFLLSIFSFFIWANISRVGYILTAYEVILTETRKYMLGAQSTGFSLWNIRTRIPPTVSTGVFSIQSAARQIVFIVCLLLLSAEAYLSFLVLDGRVCAPKWLGYVILLLDVGIAGLLVHGNLCLRQAQEFKTLRPELSHFMLYGAEPEVGDK